MTNTPAINITTTGVVCTKTEPGKTATHIGCFLINLNKTTKPDIKIMGVPHG